MPDVEVDEVVSAPIDAIWRAINDLDAYPRLIDHVRSVEVIEESPSHRVAAWEMDIKGCTMRWLEREDIDAEQFRIDYRQVEGDLQRFEGHWQLRALSPESTRATLAVGFEIGIPALSEMLDPVAESAIRENSRTTLLALAAHAVETVR